MRTEGRRENALHLAIVLMMICVVSASALAFTYQSTVPRIEAHRAEMERAAMKEVLPDANSFEEVTGEVPRGFIEEAPGLRGAFRGLSGSTTVGYVFTVATTGYSGDVVSMVGIAQGRITGLEVLRQSETPGLGARIGEAEFRAQFAGLSVDETIRTSREGGNIDVIAGATISTETVLRGVEIARQAHSRMGEER